jgi:hypothetical protein
LLLSKSPWPRGGAQPIAERREWAKIKFAIDHDLEVEVV